MRFFTYAYVNYGTLKENRDLKNSRKTPKWNQMTPKSQKVEPNDTKIILREIPCLLTQSLLFVIFFTENRVMRYGKKVSSF